MESHREGVEFDPSSSGDRAAMLVARLISAELRTAGEASEEEREEIAEKWLRWMMGKVIEYRLDWSKVEELAVEELRTRGMAVPSWLYGLNDAGGKPDVQF